MRLAILAFSERGMALGKRLQAALPSCGTAAALDRCESGGLDAWTRAHFSAFDGLVFIGSCGIAVRAIAPYVGSKRTDPAVVAVDECGTFAVSLLSGHIGGANELSRQVARCIGAAPIVTTATDRSGVFAIDSWAVRNGLFLANPARVKQISARLLAGGDVRFQSEFPVAGALPGGFRPCSGAPDVLVTCRVHEWSEALTLVPPVVTLGVGCKKGVDADVIEKAYERTLETAGCQPAAVRAVCSIDLKATEPGLVAFCQRHRLPYQTFSAEALGSVPGRFSASAFVHSVTGVDNVCERSAVLGAGSGARLLAQKKAEHGVTMALAVMPYTVRFEEEPL